MELPIIKFDVIIDLLAPIKTANQKSFSESEEVFVLDFHIEEFKDMYFRIISGMPKSLFPEFSKIENVSIETTLENGIYYLTIYENENIVFKSDSFKLLSINKEDN